MRKKACRFMTAPYVPGLPRAAITFRIIAGNPAFRL